MKDYIVFDLEWNQTEKGKELPDMPFEIIEIGAVRLNESKTETDRFDMLIKPTEYKTMFYMNRKIVNISMKDLENEEDFRTVYTEFMKWCGEKDDYIFCTWGDMDLTELQRNIRHFSLPELSDGPIKFLDIQKLYSIYKSNVGCRISLEAAVNELEINIDEPFHRAINDVRYTVEVFRKIASEEIEKKVSFNLFHLPKTKEEEIDISFDTYSKYVSRCFDSRSEAHMDSAIWKVNCYICGKHTAKEINWFTPNSQRTYLCLAKCPEHGMLRSVIRIKKAESGGYYAMRITHSASEEDIETVREKYNKTKDRDQKSNLSNSE